MTATQPKQLTPQQAAEELPIRYQQACRTAEVKTVGTPKRQCVYWFGGQCMIGRGRYDDR